MQEQQVQIDTYIDQSLITAGRSGLIGRMTVPMSTPVQAIANSIYTYARDSGIVPYETYKLTLTVQQYPSFRQRKQELPVEPGTIEILLPNDLYVTEYANITIDNVIESPNYQVPISAEIGGPLVQGLGSYI